MNTLTHKTASDDDVSFAFLISNFLTRYPAKTRDGYGISLHQWVRWCYEKQIDPLQAKRAHIESWARYLEEDLKLKKWTIATKLNGVCGVYKYASYDGYIVGNPASLVRRPKIDKVSTRQALTRSEIADLLKRAENHHPTTYALFCLLGLNGLRIGEALNANIEDLGHHRGYRTLTLHCRKGGRVGILALSVRAMYALDKVVDGRTSGPILLGKDGTRLKTGAVSRVITKLCGEVGITKRITAHSFRHTFVTLALDANVPERDIMDSTGHTDGSMIRYYDRNRGGIERNATHAVSALIGGAG